MIPATFWWNIFLYIGLLGLVGFVVYLFVKIFELILLMGRFLVKDGWK